MVELKRLRMASLLLLVLPLLSCPNPFFERVEALVGGVTVGQVGAPILSPGTGTYSTSQTISISCMNAGATIHYTTDGSTPTLSSPTYSGPFLLSSPGATIKAFAAEPGMASSAVVSAIIEIGVSTQVAMPTIGPAPGRIGHATTVSLACTTTGATIAYTTDGSTPTHGSTAYSVPFPLPYGDTTVKALAFKTGMTDSSVASSAFTEPVFVYIGSAVASDLSAQTVNLTDGSLTSAGTYGAGGITQGVAADPAGRFVFVASSSPAYASSFVINSATGTLAPAVSLLSTQFLSAAVENTGQFLYISTVATNGIVGYSIDQSTGALTQIAIFSALGNTAGIAADPVAPYLYVALNSTGQVQGYSINTTTGQLTSIGAYTSVSDTYSVVVDPTGKFLYAANRSGGQVSAFTITGSTGTLTPNGQWSAGNPIAVTIDPSGRFLYAADYSGSSIYGFLINASTGVLTPIFGPLGDPGGSSPVSLSIEPSGRFLYVAHATSTGMTIFSINSTTGVLTPTGTFAFGAYQSCVTSTGTAQ